MTLASAQVEVYLQVSETLSLERELQDSEKWQAWFQIWASQVMTESGCYELTLRLTDSAEIQALNQQYRQIDRPTDVLSFAATEVAWPDMTPEIVDAEEPLYLGDIVISLEVAQVQAREQGHSLSVELAWLACHGFLHLLGWDHPDQTSLEAMVQQQKQCLEQIGLWLGPGSEFSR